MAALHDDRGLLTGTSSQPAMAAAQRALWRMMSFYDPPLADLDDAVAHDPHWLLPRLMKAGFLLSLTEPALLPQAAQVLDDAVPLEADAPARERAHAAALRMVLEGRWQAACRAWDEVLVAHPRDALALQWAHLWDFYRGDALNLRLRVARALPEWEEGDPLYPQVLALHAFGLEECHLYPQAEEAGRRALALDARTPWAVHAVAHVMEMQGRCDEGATWLRAHQPQWAEGNGFACHLWWHAALFRLETLDTTGTLRLVDAHLAGDALQVTLQRLDAASMLWRLRLLGVDAGPRWRALVAGWPLVDEQAGHYAFNDVHAVIALLGAGDVPRAEAWLARCAARALSAEDARRSNHGMAREVGLPLMRALVAGVRGDAAATVPALYGIREGAARFGGSHAQRDLIDLSLLAAAADTDDADARAIGRAVLHERLLAKPPTPMTRHWASRLGLSPRAAGRLA
ncbi:tetratricopeptide repeat protein [Aquincola sp. MAHUQ-54]|uniref:Tetratricopeptide repeat protein 38 n=1 Tax=Aquincola agrisoli TaxID=3119538 RepID=A0AAW9QD39_9BURK